MTPLKNIFHRDVPCAGNTNTINVSKYSFARAFIMNKFVSTHTANFKFIWAFEAEKGRYSIDAG